MFNYLLKSLTLLLSLSLFTSQSVFAFATGGTFTIGGGSFSEPSSSFAFNVSGNDEIPPLIFDFIGSKENPNNGLFCMSGKISATYINDAGEEGTGVYDVIGLEGKENQGVCYSNVTRDCGDDIAGSTTAVSQLCTYQPPTIDTVAAEDIKKILNGRFKINQHYPMTGPLAVCATDEKNFCNLEVGFGFGFESINGEYTLDANGAKIPLPLPNGSDLFPASTTLNNDELDPNVIAYASEVCATFDASIFNGKVDADSSSFASKVSNTDQDNTITLCEGLVAKLHWCFDSQSTDEAPNYRPSCVTTTSSGHLTMGYLNTALGDSSNQHPNFTCADNVADLKTLSACTEQETAVLGCSSGPGYITFPTDMQTTECSAGDGATSEVFTYSSADGGGSNTTNINFIAADISAPGFAGDNSIPPILPSYTAIISTPDNQPNVWDFSETNHFKVAFIHGLNNNDEITGTNKADTIIGGSGEDTLYGGPGNDNLQGGDNVDTLHGEDGNDLLLGYECTGSNADCSTYLNKGSDNDILYGGSGDDCLDGGRGYDTLQGDGGSDAFVLHGVTNGDNITDFELGIDEVVNLIGNSETAQWVEVKGVGHCQIKTGGGSNKIVIVGDGIDDETTCQSVTVTTALPSQCVKHPAY